MIHLSRVDYPKTNINIYANKSILKLTTKNKQSWSRKERFMHTPPDANEFQPSDDTAEQVARQAVQRYAGQDGNLLPVLHAVQDTLGFIPSAAVPVLASALQLSRAEIQG